MPLPSRAIDAIFTRLLVRYGTSWARMWTDIPIDAVKADWAEQLDGMSPKAIGYALAHLPSERPPATAAVFAGLAHAMPVDPILSLDRPEVKADPKRVKAALEKLRSISSSTEKPRFAWAYSLQEREKSGERLTEAERCMWRSALEVSPITDLTLNHFKPIPEECLPPGMRSANA